MLEEGEDAIEDELEDDAWSPCTNATGWLQLVWSWWWSLIDHDDAYGVEEGENYDDHNGEDYDADEEDDDVDEEDE